MIKIQDPKKNWRKFTSKACWLERRKQTPYLTEEENQQIIDMYDLSLELGKDYQVKFNRPLSEGGRVHPDNMHVGFHKFEGE